MSIATAGIAIPARVETRATRALGTRFVAVREAHAHHNYKAALLKAGNDETVVIKRSLGIPGRALSTGWTQKILEAEAAGASREAVLELVKGETNDRGVYDGDVDGSLLWAGQAAALIDDIPSMQELIERMISRACASSQRISTILGQNGA